MSSHRYDIHCEKDEMNNDLIKYFFDIVNWIKDTFTEYNEEVLFGLDWGRIYNEYHDSISLTTKEINDKIAELVEDDEIDKKDGIVEYILSGEEKHLTFRNLKNH